MNETESLVRLGNFDWTIVGAFFAVALFIGLIVSRRSGRSMSEFFLSGRTMPWWLLGMSMVATTFSTDTPNLVTDIVRQNGVAGNWVWWAFLLTGMLTVFVYARLWRRSGVTTDVEFYELRYSGPAAAFLRGFRALYLGVFFNVIIMASVSLAAIKIGGVMLGFSPIKTILIASIVTVVFSALGGLRAVLLTDLLLFAIAMVGAVAAAVVALKQPEVGGLSGMLGHEALAGKLSVIPPLTDEAGRFNFSTLLPVFLIPITVAWWAAWYPGSEPGGGGYIAQRMLSAKDEKHAIGATLFFNAAHYALRPWPWIIVALCSLIIYPDLASISAAFPHVPEGKIGHDLAYPAMLTFLPAGLLGLVVASLIAAYMSTISTHLNWGSSYIVNDFWKRFISPDAGERELVWVGRLSTVALMVIAGAVALTMQNAKDNFDIILGIGAGTGLVYLLRWFWWRVNAWSEIAAMIAAILPFLYFRFLHHDVLVGWFGFDEQALKADAALDPLNDWKFVLTTAFTTVVWIAITFLTRPTSTDRLRAFHRFANPGGPGWRRVIDEAQRDGETITGAEQGRSNLPAGLLCMVLGSCAVYSALFGTGYWIYGKPMPAIVLSGVAIVSAMMLMRLWGRVAGTSST